eukprot:CAMPEP_0185019840 /NCGR_PEP_ID=MMETSP1103-20130426/2420_1 /TAXON_ID=36769 /ORGANISM="Paraphysomonas bandaiensis, Strain Caron Lab Isolate" /LENGTH=687 /DNA_ID=CAMNT_0027550361 /DNA_START=26 /DNA_END=2086 /DNA_ORIENTATION=+
MSLSKSEATALFNERFSAYLQEGYNKERAAAEALKDLASFQQLNRKASTAPSAVKTDSAMSLDNSADGTAVEPPGRLDPPEISGDIIQSILNECKISGSYGPVFVLINRVFSTPKLLCACFTPTSASMEIDSNCFNEKESLFAVKPDTKMAVCAYEQTNMAMVGAQSSPFSDSELDREIRLDIADVCRVYDLLVSSQHEGVVNSLMNALITLTADMPRHASSCEDPFFLKQYMIVLCHPLLLDPQYITILRSLVAAVDKLPVLSRTSLARYLETVPLNVYTHVLNVIRQHITLRMYQGAIEEARSAVRVMAILHSAHWRFPSIPLSEFTNDVICSEYMSSLEARKREYKLWLNDLGTTTTAAARIPVDRGSGTLNSFISFPYVLSPAVKAQVLELDAAVQMRQGIHQEYEDAIASGSRYMSPYLVLRVRRDQIVMDTINHFVIFADSDYKKPLKVVFDNEEGVDEGGVRKEFYQIMMKELLDPSYGMFRYYEESRLLWFNSDSFESETEFELIGILLGVAIYNSIIIDFRMPKVIYKKLKGADCTLEDLAELQPDLAAGLKKLLDFDGNVQDVFGAFFCITYETMGELKTVNLIENGSNIPVTNVNKEKYVQLYVDYMLNASVALQFNAFDRGFKKVCGGAALDLFAPSELELLICGNPELDFAALEEGTRYDDGYDGSEKVIKDFW